MARSVKKFINSLKKVRKMRKSKRSISLEKGKTGGSRRIKGRKLKNSRRRSKNKRNFRTKRRGGGNNNCEMAPDWVCGPEHTQPDECEPKKVKVNGPTFVDKIVKLGTIDIPGTMSRTLLFWNKDDYFSSDLNNPSGWLYPPTDFKDQFNKLFNFIKEEKQQETFCVSKERENLKFFKYLGGVGAVPDYKIGLEYKDLAQAMRSKHWKAKTPWKPNGWKYALKPEEEKEIDKKIKDYNDACSEKAWNEYEERQKVVSESATDIENRLEKAKLEQEEDPKNSKNGIIIEKEEANGIIKIKIPSKIKAVPYYPKFNGDYYQDCKSNCGNARSTENFRKKIEMEMAGSKDDASNSDKNDDSTRLFWDKRLGKVARDGVIDSSDYTSKLIENQNDKSYSVVVVFEKKNNDFSF